MHRIIFLDNDFKTVHSEMPVEKESDFLDKNKSIGDSAFDIIEIYGFLRD